MPRKLHLRGTLLENRHGLLVRGAAILLRPEADSPVLTGERRLALPGKPAYDTFLYQVVRVWQLPPDPLLRGGLGTLPLAPISAVTHAELPGIIEQMETRLQARPQRDYAEVVWSATVMLLGLRFSGNEVQQVLRSVLTMWDGLTWAPPTSGSRQPWNASAT